MKICFLTKTIFDLGGVQRVLTVVASGLSKTHDVTVLCTDGECPLNRSLYNLDEKVHVDINPDLLHKKILSKCFGKLMKDINSYTGMFNNNVLKNILIEAYYPLKSRKKLIKYFNDNKFDLIIGVEGFYSILLAIISSSLNCKTMGWQHNSYDAYLKNKHRYYWNQDIFFDLYLKNLDKYVVLNNYDADRYLQEKNIKCDVIYNPKSFVSKEKSYLSKKQFMASGRFNYQKGFDLLIKSFYDFSKKNKDWNLVIVGEGEEKNKLLSMIAKYELQDRVRIDGFTDNIKKYFLESSVFLLSSRWEGMPMIVLESLEMGVPVISYDITAIQPLVEDGKEGFIVDKYNTYEFSEAMLKLSDSYELRLKMAENISIKSKKFDIDHIIDKWNKVISDIEN